MCKKACLQCGGKHIIKECKATKNECINCKVVAGKLNLNLDIEIGHLAGYLGVRRVLLCKGISTRKNGESNTDQFISHQIPKATIQHRSGIGIEVSKCRSKSNNVCYKWYNSGEWYNSESRQKFVQRVNDIFEELCKSKTNVRWKTKIKWVSSFEVITSYANPAPNQLMREVLHLQIQ